MAEAQCLEAIQERTRARTPIMQATEDQARELAGAGEISTIARLLRCRRADFTPPCLPLPFGEGQAGTWTERGAREPEP
jgi:hypothetical protein